MRARVAVEHRGWYVLYADGAEVWATLAGRLRHEAESRADLPVVGDWVVARIEGDSAAIEAVLPRATQLARKAAGLAAEMQLIAANVDTVFIVSGLDHDYNLRRIERYVAFVRSGGAESVVLLNKSDLCHELEQRLDEVSEIGTKVVALSAREGAGVEQLEAYLDAGQTVALVGSSGAGKSTLTNRLLGYERQATNEVREGDARGRHTTTRRELVVLPGGAFLIDTPGLRELQLWAGGDDVAGSFADIEELAAECRFADCSHHVEAADGCAVVAALEAGTLDAGRFDNFQKLLREAAYLEHRVDVGAARAQKQQWKAIHKAMRTMPKKGR
ncbi:MAG: ribosome small subunit-dependent GTPase A [Bryobacteraceae bacterium]